MKKHVEYATELARKAYNKCFKSIILYGSVAVRREHKNSDIDILFIEKEKKDWDLWSRIYDMTRESKIRFDLQSIDESTLENSLYISETIRKLDNPLFYINAMSGGKVFDGKCFSRNAMDDPFIRRCVETMKVAINGIDLKGYNVRPMPKASLNYNVKPMQDISLN